MFTQSTLLPEHTPHVTETSSLLDTLTIYMGSIVRMYQFIDQVRKWNVSGLLHMINTKTVETWERRQYSNPGGWTWRINSIDLPNFSKTTWLSKKKKSLLWHFGFLLCWCFNDWLNIKILLSQNTHYKFLPKTKQDVSKNTIYCKSLVAILSLWYHKLNKFES